MAVMRTQLPTAISVELVVSPFGRVVGDRTAVDEVMDRLGDVGGVIADALEVLGAEQQMRATGRCCADPPSCRSGARGTAELYIASSCSSSRQTAQRLVGIALGVGVEHVLELAQRQLDHVAEPDQQRLRMALAGDRQRPLGDVLGEIADPLEIAAIFSAAMMWRRSSAIGWRRAMIMIACSSISRCSSSIALSLAIAASASRGSRRFERVERLAEQPLGQTAHLRDAIVEQVELVLVGLDGMLRPSMPPRIRSTACRSAEAAGDVVLRALVLRRR